MMKWIQLLFLALLITVLGCTTSQEPNLTSNEDNSPANTSIPKPLFTNALAFPGAEGYGAKSIGGRGGAIYYVTNLNDSGPGSFREAVDAQGPRIVLFKVSGTIYLQSPLELCNPYITIAGQTAPGDGICIANSAFFIYGPINDVIIRGLRFRPGDLSSLPARELDAIAIYGQTENKAVSDVIIDHCSLSWAIDETFQILDYARDITLQWSMVTESLDSSSHPEGPHGYAILSRSAFDNGGISMHHNLIAHHQGRNPKFAGNIYDTTTATLHDFRNNVVYNHGTRPALSGKENLPVRIRVNFTDNYYKPGPDTRDGASQNILFIHYEGNAQYYMRDNFLVGNDTVSADNWRGVAFWNTPLCEPNIRTNVPPFNAPPVSIYSSAELYQRVLNNAGCTVPRRDPVDMRIVDEVRNGGGRIIDSQNEVGGWPLLLSNSAPLDSDGDGMPDDWENANGLDPNNPADGPLDPDGDGYTNVEDYINGLIPMPL